MPVTIRILSGARQGDEILLDAREFRIGDGPECEVCFDPQADPAAQGRLAKIRLKDDGWYVRPDASGAMLLNRSTIAGETHLRSGDVLRMSPTGPDVLFAISAIAPSSATTAAAEIPRPVERKPADVPRSAPAVTGNQETLTVSASSASSTPAPDSGPAPSRRRTWAALAVSAALLVASAWWVFASGRHGVGPAAQSAQAEPDAGPASDRTAAEGGSPPVLNVPAELALKAGEETVFSVSAVIPGRPASRPTLRADGAPDWVKIDADSGTIHCTPPATANGTFELKISAIDKDQPSLVTQAVVKLQVSGDPWTRVQEELGEAVFLVLVEAGNEETARTWPFATCSAIGDSTLLTTARETAQLAVWRGQGFRIWVSRSTDGPRIEVKDLRVHRQFVPLADKPGDWVYANLGLLVTEEKLPRAARLASTDELRELEEGLPLACFGFSH
ncbi:MAG: hypothetical protein HUU20_18405, partial [Pirellulales bacterium]|nr:hypothetical protein [Pirellulales bacterium]